MAFEGPSGRPLWAAEAGGAGGVGVASDRLVVSDAAGTVWGIDKYVGTSYWQQPALARRKLAPAAVHGDHAVVGDLDGYLHWLRLSDGEFAARERASRSAFAGRPADPPLGTRPARSRRRDHRRQRPVAGRPRRPYGGGPLRHR